MYLSFSNNALNLLAFTNTSQSIKIRIFKNLGTRKMDILLICLISLCTSYIGRKEKRKSKLCKSKKNRVYPHPSSMC
jgi:hypothetical protein